LQPPRVNFFHPPFSAPPFFYSSPSICCPSEGCFATPRVNFFHPPFSAPPLFQVPLYVVRARAVLQPPRVNFFHPPFSAPQFFYSSPSICCPGEGCFATPSREFFLPPFLAPPLFSSPSICCPGEGRFATPTKIKAQSNFHTCALPLFVSTIKKAACP